MKQKEQDGTALTEFAVIMVVMVPLMFGIPMIGKMIDLKQTTVQASRYSAWETTVQADPQATGSLGLDELFYGDASAPIGQSSEQGNTLWGADATALSTPTGEPLAGYMADTAVVVSGAASRDVSSAYELAEKNGVVFGPSASRGAAFEIGGAIEKLGVLEGPTDGDWTMQTDGLVRGVASVTMDGNGWLDSMTFTQGTVIMNDNWSVADAEAARNRIRPLVPANGIDVVGKFLYAIGQVPGISELKEFGRDGRGVFGHIDMEPLPKSETETLRPLKTYKED